MKIILINQHIDKFNIFYFHFTTLQFNQRASRNLWLMPQTYNITFFKFRLDESIDSNSKHHIIDYSNDNDDGI